MNRSGNILFTSLLFVSILRMHGSAQAPRHLLAVCFYETPRSGQVNVSNDQPKSAALSADGGESWKYSGFITGRANDLAVHTANPSIFFLATDYGLLRSTDQGALWKQVTNWEIETVLAVKSMADVVWIMTPKGPFISFNDGDTWTHRAKGLQPLDGTYSSDMLLTDHRLFLATAAGLYQSSDMGASWEPSNLYGRPVEHLTRHPFHMNMLAAYSSDALWLSNDGGNTWEQAETHSGHPIQCVQFKPGSGSELMIGTQNSGVLSSRDFGKSWENTSSGIMNLNVTALHFDTRDPTIVFCGTENGSYISRDAGRSWSAFTIRLGYISAIRQF